MMGYPGTNDLWQNSQKSGVNHRRKQLLTGALYMASEIELDGMQNRVNAKLEHVARRGNLDKLLKYADRVVVDDVVLGLRFVAKSGVSGAWIRRWKTKAGSMKQYTFAKYPETSLADARQYVELVRGQDHPLIQSMGPPTIGRLVDVYLDEYVKAQRQPQGLLNARSVLIKNLKPISTRKLDEVTASMLHEVIMRVRKRAPTQAASLRAELKQAWAYGLSIGLTDVICPITSLTGGRFKKNTRDRVLSDAEVPELLANMGCYSQALQDVIVICLYTGLRSGEVVKIRHDWVDDWDSDLIWMTIPREHMKNDLPHRVPLIGRAAHAVFARSSVDSDYVFPKKRKPEQHITQTSLSREVNATESPVGHWCLHDLRRTARTNLQRIGCPFEVSETILAHKLPGVSAVYARYHFNDEKLQWLKKLADYYDGLVKQ